MRHFFIILLIPAVWGASLISLAAGPDLVPEPENPTQGDLVESVDGERVSEVETVSPVVGSGKPSNIKSDEQIVFFNTAARVSYDGGDWILLIHGWVFEPVDSTFRKAAIARVLRKTFGLVPTDKTSANFARRTNLFLADNERDKRILVRIGTRKYSLPESQSNGHFKALIRVPAADVKKLAPDGVLRFTAVLPDGDKRVVSGRVRLIGKQGVSVISDIDDTVKVTEVINQKSMVERTFFRDFEAAEGMAVLYGRWAKTGAEFHYVSSSPWQLYEPLAEFLDQHGFPPATLSLKSIRLKDKTILDLFKKGTETKPLQIEPILKAYPQRDFVLVGDSGEQDPEVYAAMMRKYPQQIRRIYIRNVNDSSATDARFQKVFRGIDAEKWTLFKDPTQLQLPALDPRRP